MATETLSYDVTVSAGQASKEIDKLEGAFKKAADSARAAKLEDEYRQRETASKGAK